MPSPTSTCRVGCRLPAVRLERAQQAATVAGLVTAPTGVTLLAAPQVGGVAGLTGGLSRAIGAADVLLAIGLLAGRPRWPWATARAAANLPTAAAFARTGTPLGRVIAVGLLLVTSLDLSAARTLHASRL